MPIGRESKLTTQTRDHRRSVRSAKQHAADRVSLACFECRCAKNAAAAIAIDKWHVKIGNSLSKTERPNFANRYCKGQKKLQNLTILAAENCAYYYVVGNERSALAIDQKPFKMRSEVRIAKWSPKKAHALAMGYMPYEILSKSVKFASKMHSRKKQRSAFAMNQSRSEMR